MREYQRRFAKMAIGWVMVALGLFAWSGVAPTQRPGRPIISYTPLSPFVPAPDTWTPTLPN